MARLEDRYEYDAFGKPYKGELNEGMNLGYTGKPYDTATGMYNYGYRDYKPEQARFTTVDPIRDGSNWFAYVNNDPVNWYDPFGLECVGPDSQAKVDALETRTNIGYIPDEVKEKLEKEGWTYVGDNQYAQKSAANDIREKAADPYWEVTVSPKTVTYQVTEEKPIDDWTGVITGSAMSGRFGGPAPATTQTVTTQKSMTGNEYSAITEHGEQRYLDMDQDTHIDFWW